MKAEKNIIHPLVQVAEFHTTFNHPIQAAPVIPDPARCDLRVELITEELRELTAGIVVEDLVEVADALCDLQYVLSGAILEFGLAEKFPELFAEVHRSNMSKSCDTYEQALENISAYLKEGVNVSTKKVGEKYVLFRVSDNKVIKSKQYSPANLEAILNQ